MRGRSLVIACERGAIYKVFRVSGLDGICAMTGAAPDDLAASR